MKKLLILAALLVGCDPGPPIKCDYCHVLRSSVTRYTCAKCKLTHLTCDVDKQVLHYEEVVGYRGFMDKVAVCVTTCPTPEGPAPAAVDAAPEPCQHQTGLGLTITAITAIGLFFIGYAKGRHDQRKQPTGKSFG